MMMFLGIGAVIVVLTVIMSYLELIPFLKAIHTIPSVTTGDRLLYPIRFITVLPLAWPALCDVGVAFICGSIGLNGGVMGALIGLMFSFTVSVAIKIHRHFVARKWNVETTVTTCNA
jgi:hypothetical protein